MKRIVLGMIAASTLATVADAAVPSYLVRQWFDKGAQMCQYDNGTVLNMGSKLCPLKI